MNDSYYEAMKTFLEVRQKSQFLVGSTYNLQAGPVKIESRIKDSTYPTGH